MEVINRFCNVNNYAGTCVDLCWDLCGFVFMHISRASQEEETGKQATWSEIIIPFCGHMSSLPMSTCVDMCVEKAEEFENPST